MRRLVSLLTLFFVAYLAPAQAADIAYGYELSRSCALCHGAYGQGASGQLSPRIAGLPKEYILKAMKDYVSGKRIYPLMVRTSKIDKWTDTEFEAVAAYYSSLDLSSDQRFNIIAGVGDPKAGHKIYKKECKNCHAKDGYGKPRKEAPPLAGQHPEYLFTMMRTFAAKAREHANDPEDETFEDFNDQDFINISAYLSTLDDKKILDGYVFTPPQYRMAKARHEQMRKRADKGKIEITDIKQTVVKMALDEGVTTEQAEEAMMAKAEAIKLKKVAQQRVSKFLKKKGVDMPHLSIFQFCNPMDARTMVIANPVFSSYMPCRISMVEDENGKLWLMMLNLDMLINSELLPADVVETAVKVNQQMLDVMAAGASGKAE